MMEEKLAKPIETTKEKKLKKVSNKKVSKMLEKRKLELSFEVKEQREKFPEIEWAKAQLVEGEETIGIYLKAGLYQQARALKKQMTEAKCEIEMLDMVMNLDFSRPWAQAME